MQVWKYNLEPGTVIHEVPTGATALSCGPQMQGEGAAAVVWVLVDPAAPKKPLKFLTVATGETMPEGSWSFVGSLGFNAGALIFHVFVDSGE